MLRRPARRGGDRATQDQNTAAEPGHHVDDVAVGRPRVTSTGTSRRYVRSVSTPVPCRTDRSAKRIRLAEPLRIRHDGRCVRCYFSVLAIILRGIDVDESQAGVHGSTRDRTARRSTLGQCSPIDDETGRRGGGPGDTGISATRDLPGERHRIRRGRNTRFGQAEDQPGPVSGRRGRDSDVSFVSGMGPNAIALTAHRDHWTEDELPHGHTQKIAATHAAALRRRCRDGEQDVAA